MSASAATPNQSDIEYGLRASDFLLDPDAFVGRCIAAYPEADAALTSPQRVALADAIRAGRPRIEVVEAIRRYVAPSARMLDGSPVSGIARDWSNHVVTEQLARYAPGDNSAFVQQVYSQILGRSPSPIEAIEARFDLREGSLSRTEFIQHIALRSPLCHLSTDPSPVGVGFGVSREAKPFFNLIEPSPTGGWIVAQDMYLRSATTVEGTLQVAEGFILSGPKRTFPSGMWNLSIDIVQPETARITVDIVANSGLDVLTKFDLVGPARLVTAVVCEPWHHFLEVRLFKGVEPEALRKLKVRELVLRQP